MFKYEAIVWREKYPQAENFFLEAIGDAYVDNGHLVIRNTAVFAPGAWTVIYYREIPTFDRDERIELTKDQISGIAWDIEYTKSLAKMAGKEMTMQDAVREVIGRIEKGVHQFPDGKEGTATIKGIEPE